MQLTFIDLPNNHRIAYNLSEGAGPCVMFCSGFKSDMTGSKATALEKFCKERGQRFIRFDYSGHGASSGDFKDGTIGDWKNDALAVLDQLGSEKNILVGSSMGAWISLLVARERPQKITAFIGVASAPDFTEKLIWEKLTSDQQKQLQNDGVFYAPSCYGEEPYPITLKLIEEARNHLLLDADIKLDVPVRLLHGTHDEDVPWQISTQLMQRISSKDITLTLVKDGNHRLSEPQHLDMMCKAVASLS